MSINASTEKCLQKIVDETVIVVKIYEIKINTKKTKVMMVGRRIFDYGTIWISIDREKLQEVEEFKHLERLFVCEWLF